MPQGSVFGPSFYLLHINDFPKSISNKSNPTLFADDMSIIIINPTPNIRMDLQEVGCGYGDWIGLAQDRDGWWKLVNAVMNLRVP